MDVILPPRFLRASCAIWTASLLCQSHRFQTWCRLLRRMRCLRLLRLLRLSRLLLPDLRQHIWVPTLRHVRVALTPIRKRGFPKVIPPALDESELHVIAATAFAVQDLPSQPANVIRHVHRLKLGVIAHALEEGNAEARALASLWGEDAVSSAGADAIGERFKALADGDDQGAADGWAVDPFSLGVLSLEAFHLAGLEQVASEHAVLVRSDSLANTRAVVGVFDDLQLMLLIFVKEPVECIWLQSQAFGDQACEDHTDIGHLANIVFVDGSERRHELSARPLVWAQQVVVNWCIWLWERMWRAEIELLPPVCLESSYLVTQL